MTTITNLDQLEDLISELTNKVNQLSQDMHDFKEKSRRENDGLRQKIADLSSQVEQLLHEKQPLKKEQPNDGVGLGGIAPTNLYRERRASEPEKYKCQREKVAHYNARRVHPENGPHPPTPSPDPSSLGASLGRGGANE